MMRIIVVPILVLALLSGCASAIRERKVSSKAPEAFQPENYKLVASDVVRVDVFQEPDMGGEQRIAQDGSVSIPLAGRVVIAGLTIHEAASAIAGALKGRYLVSPQVSVNVVTYAPQRFTILGQVNSPGVFEIPSEEVIFLPNAVAMAGGNTRIGNLRSVTITRVRADGIFEIKVNLLNPQGRQFIVEKGDIITVPESLF